MNVMKNFQKAMARQGLVVSFWILKYLPYFVVKAFANTMIFIAYIFVGRHKKIARESLQIAFEGRKKEQEVNKIIKECFSTLGRGMIEMLYCLSHPNVVKSKVKFQGKKNLDEALKKGKGVIAVTGHFGNFPLMMLGCIQKGYKVSSIIRPVRDEKMEKFLFQKRAESGLNTVYAIPRTECVKNSIKALRDNGILFVPLDQNFGNGKGVFVDFFGQKAATATGPVVFSSRTDAVILPMFIVRQKNDTHKIIIEPPIKIEKGADEKESTYLTISRITRIIESYIRKYPYEWGWMHKRWKSKPKGQKVE